MRDTRNDANFVYEREDGGMKGGGCCSGCSFGWYVSDNEEKLAGKRIETARNCGASLIARMTYGYVCVCTEAG